ncbi:DUF1186 domain-containing protein [Stenomitos frigidus]|uniref:PBS lyase n=1 Tax=Stenomitos frigidus ULC18 TaxID=2107698 RepID=A0A2T1DUS8_9CYAN|nr:DUF1186 domain-containing protein [Stenomitos frigidus]PSB24263.1 hypothetical protein C7B82_27665 [Stenomitos frigidus ULC18]
MSLDTYSDPVAKLLTYGDCHEMDLHDWHNYPETVGLTANDIPELIRMATDPAFWALESEQLEVWAPIHAWRSLGQLHAEAAIAPLTQLFGEHDSDWITEEIPKVYAMLGPAAIPVLADYLTDASHETFARNTAVDCLLSIAQSHPESRDACIAPMLQQLESFAENDITLNTILIGDLLDLKAVEAAPLMEPVFAAEQVDEFMVGSWAGVQVELGLKQESDFDPDALKPKMSPELTEMQQLLKTLEALDSKPQGFGKATQPKAQKGKKKKKK